MSHKVHPKVFRIREIADWDSRWLNKKRYPAYLEEDFKIRKFLDKKLARVGVEKIEIERSFGKLNVIISSSRPGLIFGRGGSGIEELKKEIEKKLLKKIDGKIPELKLEIKEIRNPMMSATLSAQAVAQQLEKRTPYRRVLKQAIEKIMAEKEVKGVRIEAAGRLDGVEIGRTEWLQKGQLPRQTIRANIDYGTAEAACTYGRIGIKVWMYKGEKF
ncbi:MAG: 30S ribosomal protein S3 [Candidatus Pacebacteria bacterium]|nr:30S ribosomal protein S3 [Candidatus Paceibacterota bacterium]